MLWEHNTPEASSESDLDDLSSVGRSSSARSPAPDAAEATAASAVVKGSFRPDHYVLSVHCSTLLIVLICGTYFIAPIRPVAQCLGDMPYRSGWDFLACRIPDVTVWGYMASITVTVAVKWWHYKKMGFHYFILDYCYFHNAFLITFFLSQLVEFEWYGFASPSGTLLPFRLHLVTLEAYSRWLSLEASSTAAAASLWRFHVLLGGSIGTILGAVFVWGNALLLHDLDKMSSCFLHFGAPTVQAIWLHFLSHSPKAVERAANDAEVAAATAWPSVLMGHFCMYVAWQLFHYGFIEARDATGRWREERARSRLVHLQRELQKQEELSAQRAGLRARGQSLSKRAADGDAKVENPVAKLRAKIDKLKSELQQRAKIAPKQAEPPSPKKQDEGVPNDSLASPRNNDRANVEMAVHNAESVVAQRAGYRLRTRETSYSWMMNHPPLGKKGLPYRFVTCLGMGGLQTKFLFAVIQWALHVVFFVVGYVGVVGFAMAHPTGTWAPLAYIVVYYHFAVRNAGNITSKWVRKLAASNEGPQNRASS